MKIKINKIEKSDTYNGDTVFKIEGSELNWNGRIDVEYGYNKDNKMRIKCYHLTIEAENSVTGEQIQKTFPVVGRWETKCVGIWYSEYDTNHTGWINAKDAKKAMIQYIKEWAKIEETSVEAVEVETVEVEETSVEAVETTQTNNQSTTDDPSQVTPQPEEPIMAQSTKIIVVTYHSYIQKWYPLTPENMESILLDFDNIVEIQIIEQGE